MNKMTRISTIAITLLMVSFFATAQNKEDVSTLLQDIKTDVVYLASDYCEGRETGQVGETRAAEYIVHRYKKIGLKPAGTNGTYYQEFPFQEMVNPHATHGKEGKKGTGKNVVALLDNGAENTIVIGAHYDHLGMGNIGSLHAGEPAIHNGADDNASGIAAMLRIAEHFKNSKAKNNNFLFIGFSGEEMGLFGSKYFTANPTIDLQKVNFMFNMDMIGMLNEEKVLAVQATGTSPVWNDLLENTKMHDLQIKMSQSGIGPSDHTSFYLKNIPVLHFFTGQHKHYHKPTDDSHLLNYQGIIEVSDFMIALIEKLNDEGKIKFTKTKDENQRQAAAFKVTLGIMPDYVYNGKGMRIDSVIEGRVGDKGGIKDGDIVIKMGDIEVTDIYKYMEGLSKFKKGETAEVVVLRKNKKKKLKVTF